VLFSEIKPSARPLESAGLANEAYLKLMRAGGISL
jgi:hypothetical protein